MKWLWITTALVLLLGQAPANAQGSEITGPVVSRIESQGYTISRIARTWLGRIVITAHDGRNLREVVVNRTNGEILRDSLFPLPDSLNTPVPEDKGSPPQGFDGNARVSDGDPESDGDGASGDTPVSDGDDGNSPDSGSGPNSGPNSGANSGPNSGQDGEGESY